MNYWEKKLIVLPFDIEQYLKWNLELFSLHYKINEITDNDIIWIVW